MLGKAGVVVISLVGRITVFRRQAGHGAPLGIGGQAVEIRMFDKAQLLLTGGKPSGKGLCLLFGYIDHGVVLIVFKARVGGICRAPWMMMVR